MIRHLITGLILLALGRATIEANGAPARPAEGKIVWVETERFQEPGGWINDSQFIDQMGSPYLMANGMGAPVKDAATPVELPQAGRWRVWLRTKDWYPANHPGAFKLLIDGKEAGQPLGSSGKPGWIWEDGGMHELKATAELRLRDLTGYYGRCDAIVLALDPNWVPPAEVEAIAKLREEFGGISRDVRDLGDYDVVVIGGGLAGCMAAVGAARLGASVALVQDRPVLGGNGSTEVIVPPVGLTNAGKRNPLDPRETGLLEEIRTAGLQRVAEVRTYSTRLRRLVENEPTLKLFLNTHATGVEMKDKGTIAAVTAVDTLGGQRLRLSGRLFIDCSGDSLVGVAAGAEWRQGREGRAEFGETMAPEVANKTTMGNSLKYVALPSGGAQSFTPPAWAMKFPDEKFPKMRHPRHPDLDIGWQWMLELGGMGDTYIQKEETRDELFRLIYGLWDHMKNVCPEFKAKMAHYKLEWVQTVVGVRESRRLIGDYIFTENDVAKQIMHPDRIGYGSWGLDDHPSEGFFNWERNNNHKFGKRLHSIPYRILYSKNVGNLMMAGRNVSASHVGMGTTRVMITCAVMGQAAGTAAGLCIRHGSTPRGIYQDHREELQQQLLKTGAYMFDLPNRDPRDLARQARLSASSEGTTRTAAGRKEKMVAANAIDGTARVTADGRTHAWQADKGAPGPHWIELAWPQAQKFNMAHVTFFRKETAAPRFGVEAWLEGRWIKLADFETDGKFRRCLVPLAATTASRLRVVLDKPAGVCEIRVYDEPDAELELARRATANMRQPDRGAALPWEKAEAGQ